MSPRPSPRAAREALHQLASHPARRAELRGRILRPYQRRRFAEFGPRSIVDRPAWVLGAHQMAFGTDVLVLRGCSLSVEEPAWDASMPALRFGNRVGVRPYCTFSAAASITIEDDVIMGSFTSIVDSDHTFALGRANVMHNPLDSAPVRIGRGTWLAERVAVLRGAHIGRCCIIGANSVVRGEIPDCSIAVGAPARIVGAVDGVDPDSGTLTVGLWRT